jgi:hypothetical protein
MIKTTLLGHDVIAGAKTMLLAGVLAGGILVSGVRAQSAAPAGAPAAAPQAAAQAGPQAARGAPYRFQQNRLSKRANTYYGLVWGVDDLSVKWVESGELIRFSYRVVNAEQAKTLSDKKSEPHLISPAEGVSLVIPSLEKVGQLRQSSTPIEGRSYWMAFSNRGRRVKRGDRVDVVIGQFRAQGLVVE